VTSPGGARPGPATAGAGAAWRAAASVVDPELRAVTIEDLGILRGVEEIDGEVVVTITPTYSGCPAMDVIRADVARAVTAAGWPRVRVRTVLAPAWGTGDITERGRRKLAEAGIAPPGPATRRAPGAVPVALSVRCPRCGSARTRELARFGSTSCKALWRCEDCSEPFEHVKAV
jgi:ring-1,2-phenylacetyl-CoA epoxidase subunit PaaD